MASWITWMVESARPVAPKIELSFPDAGALTPLAGICAGSILISVLWLVVVWQYVGSKSKHHG